MSIGDVCAIIGAVVSLGGVGLILVKVGGVLKVVEMLQEDLRNLRPIALEWRSLNVRLDRTEEDQEKMNSDISELKSKADRRSCASIHDGE